MSSFILSNSLLFQFRTSTQYVQCNDLLEPLPMIIDTILIHSSQISSSFLFISSFIRQNYLLLQSHQSQSSYWSCFYLLSAPSYIFSIRTELLLPTCGTLLRFTFMSQFIIPSAPTYDYTWSCYYLLSLYPCVLNLYCTSSAFLVIQLEPL